VAPGKSHCSAEVEPNTIQLTSVDYSSITAKQHSQASRIVAELADPVTFCLLSDTSAPYYFHPLFGPGADRADSLPLFPAATSQKTNTSINVDRQKQKASSRPLTSLLQIHMVSSDPYHASSHQPCLLRYTLNRRQR